MSTSTQSVATSQRSSRLPLGALVIMALTGFIVIMTETLPAGLLPQLAAGLNTSEGGAGQLVGIYALGTVIVTIPAIALTRGIGRKPLLLAGLVGFLLANTVTALVPDYTVIMVARFIAGGFAGLLWGMLATYARAISPADQAGRGLSIAMTGTPVALAIGTPIGTWLGSFSGWQLPFWVMSALTVVIIVAALIVVPNAPGAAATKRMSIPRVIAIPGVAAILLAVFAWLLAHNLLYTYIAPYLTAAGLGLRPDVALLIFGVASLVGIWVTGTLIDRFLRRLALAGTALMVAAGAALALISGNDIVAIIAIIAWGIAFGGAATQLQTAMGIAAGENADVANAVLTASFNLAIFAAAAGGAIVLETFGALSMPIAMLIVAAVAFLTILFGRKAAFPARR